MTKIEKEKIINVVKKCFNDVITQYKKSNVYYNDMLYTKIDYIVKIDIARRKDDVMQHYNNAIKQITQWQTDLAIHKLRHKNII